MKFSAATVATMALSALLLSSSSIGPALFVSAGAPRGSTTRVVEGKKAMRSKLMAGNTKEIMTTGKPWDEVGAIIDLERKTLESSQYNACLASIVNSNVVLVLKDALLLPLTAGYMIEKKVGQ